MLKALLTDIDGTITDSSRRIHTGSIDTIRSLVDQGIIVVLASGNAPCFMEALCKMIGTQGTFIAENGGIIRVGYTGTLQVYRRPESPPGGPCDPAGPLPQEGKGTGTLQPHIPPRRPGIRPHRAFHRSAGDPQGIPGTGDRHGYAIHLQSPGVNKGTALVDLAGKLGIPPGEFLAIGDSVNDIQMLRTAGIGITVANAHPETKAVAIYVAEKEYGDGFVEAVKKYSSYFRAR